MHAEATVAAALAAPTGRSELEWPASLCASIGRTVTTSDQLEAPAGAIHATCTAVVPDVRVGNDGFGGEVESDRGEAGYWVRKRAVGGNKTGADRIRSDQIVQA
jgi:hypothetical protein